MLESPLTFLTTAFNAMDKFGHEHWGFILTFVFGWWLLDRFIIGIKLNVRHAQRHYSHRKASGFSYHPQTRPRSDLSGAGFNTPPKPFVDSSKHTASTQAGINSFKATDSGRTHLDNGPDGQIMRFHRNKSKSSISYFGDGHVEQKLEE